MPKIQITLTEEEDHEVELYKAENSLDNKEEAIKGIIAERIRKRR
jgi:hypothetical protein